MNILMTGGTGFIGSALLEQLLVGGARVTVLSRQNLPDRESVRYVSSLAEIQADEVFEVFINLAGESLAEGRWTARRKQVLFDSRIRLTEELVALSQRLQQPPATVLSASAIGFYGHHGDERVDESGTCNDGFSHQLCSRWEQAAKGFAAPGVRVVTMRLGVVLGPEQGALREMMRSFTFGVGSWVGSGRQWLSWIHRADVVAAIEFLLANDTLSGAFNLTAPEPVTHREFCRSAAAVKTVLLSLPVPGPVLRLALGEMAEELLLNGQRVVPTRLLASGFRFHYPHLDAALRDLII